MLYFDEIDIFFPLIHSNSFFFISRVFNKYSVSPKSGNNQNLINEFSTLSLPNLLIDNF